MDEILKIAKNENLTYKVKNALKKYIVMKGLKEGDKLPSEQELSRLFMVSRNVVREAMKSLEALGIIKKRQGLGLFVDSVNISAISESILFGLDKYNINLEELFKVRKAFEISVLGIAVKKITSDDIRDLQLIIDNMKKKEEEKFSSIRLDLEFHIRLMEIVNNDAIKRIWNVLITFFRELLLSMPNNIFGKMEYSKKESEAIRHQRLLDVLKEGDTEKAVEAMQKHLEYDYRMDDGKKDLN
jgi:GntR family transcriptional regulator, transcriptional repressor for pyruvate dehydrogenase complex